MATLHWAEQYLIALKVRDGAEKANARLYEHCTRIEDEKADLAQQITQAAQRDAEGAKTAAAVPAPSRSPSLSPYLFRVSSPQAPASAPAPAPRSQSPLGMAEMRQDLARAQQERSELQQRLELMGRDLDALRLKSRKDGKKLGQTTAQVALLTTKLRDRDEELKGKAKLVENVQDENVTLNLQLNLAEERVQKLQDENQELVDRWMARMGKEAEHMNEETERLAHDGRFG